MVRVFFFFILFLQGGLYVLNLIDTYIGGMILPIIAAFELFTVCWMYGELPEPVEKMGTAGYIFRTPGLQLRLYVLLPCFLSARSLSRCARRQARTESYANSAVKKCYNLFLPYKRLQPICHSLRFPVNRTSIHILPFC